MATLTHGIKTGVAIAGYDFTGFCTDVGIDRTMGLADTTAFGGATGPYYTSRVSGITDGKANINGLWDATATSGLDPRADAMEGSNVGLIVAQQGFTVTAGPTSHNRVWFGKSTQSKYSQKHTKTGAAMFSLDWESIGANAGTAQGGVMHGYLLHQGAETFTGSAQNGTTVQITMPLGISVTGHGAVGIFMLQPAAPSSNLAVLIQSSSDNFSTSTTRITFTSTKSIGDEIIIATGDFHADTYWRARWTGTNADTGTFLVAVGLY